MKITKEQYGKIEPILPKQRGNVSIDNLTFINALLYICENGCKWRGLPEKFGYWHGVYKRFSRWVKAGIIDRLFRELHVQDVLSAESLALFLDSMTVKVHPDALRGIKKNGKQAIGRSKGGLTTKVHLIAANEKTAVEFILSEGQLHDAPQGRLLMDTVGKLEGSAPIVMDRAYEDDYTRCTAWTLGFKPVVPPKKNRLNPWEYDRELYKRRNEIERLFRLIKGFCRIFTRFEKMDSMFAGFIQLAFVFVAVR
jgi:transposase